MDYGVMVIWNVGLPVVRMADLIIDGDQSGWKDFT